MKKKEFKKLSVIDSFKLILADDAPFGYPVCMNPKCECYLIYNKDSAADAGMYPHKSSGKMKQRYQCKKCGNKFFQHSFGFESEVNFKNPEIVEKIKYEWCQYLTGKELMANYSISKETLRKFLAHTAREYRSRIRDYFFANEVGDITTLEIPLELSSKNSKKISLTVFIFFNSDLNILNFAVVPSGEPFRLRLLEYFLKFYKDAPFNKTRDDLKIVIDGPNLYPFARATHIEYHKTFKRLGFPQKWIYQVETSGHLKERLSLFAMVYNNRRRKLKKAIQKRQGKAYPF